MVKFISISDILKQEGPVTLLDARSEAEFQQGSINGAVSFPILNNEERVLVGTCYKKQGHEKAVILGYELVGPKFSQYLQAAYNQFSSKEIYVHCWRGGLRSQILGNLLSSGGFRVNILKGGYKSYRQEVIEFLNRSFQFEVLGGLTGSGKTEILQKMIENGFQCIDIEGLAVHKGSAFGALGLQPQPTQEQFENNLFETIRKFDFSKPIWIEDESRLIGKLQIPNQIHAGIRNGFVHFLDYPFEFRLNHILKEYGILDPALLSEITLKLRKRMGDLNNRLAIEALVNGNINAWGEAVLKHYDKQYTYGFGLRNPMQSRKIQTHGEELIHDLEKVKKQKATTI